MQDIIAIIKEFLTVGGMSFSDVEEAQIAGQTVLNIKTDDARAIIGQRGDTIRSIDYLVKKIAEKRGLTEFSFLVDAGSYRSERIKELQSKVLMMAERARSLRYDVELTPMSAYERLIVHTTLQGVPDVKTESQGEGHNRRVIIKFVSGEAS